MATTESAARSKLAELASTIGASLIGFGAGGWLASNFQRWALPIAALGMLLHAFGMYDKHRAERAMSEGGILWAKVLYWLCWVALALGAVWLALRGEPGLSIALEERAIQVREEIGDTCDLFGLDPQHVANEGRFIDGVAERCVIGRRP